MNSAQQNPGVEKWDQPKLFEIVRQWRIRHGVLGGLLEDGNVIQEAVLRVLKEAEDTVVVETAERFYLLDPPRNIDFEETE